MEIIILGFMLFGLCYIVWNNVSVSLSERREKSARRMDSAEFSHRDEFMEENPWDAR